MSRKVVFALPSHNGQIWLPTMESIMRSQSELRAQDVRTGIIQILFSPYIAYARSLLISMFLASDADDLVFIDTDLIWEAGVMPRLLSHDVDIVAGIYPKKMADPPLFPIRVFDDENVRADGLLRVQTVPTGFMRIRRSALEKLVASYPDLNFKDDAEGQVAGCHLFMDFLHNGICWQEDYAFCHRWRAIGGEVWADTELNFFHIGTKAYAGEFGHWFRNQHHGKD